MRQREPQDGCYGAMRQRDASSVDATRNAWVAECR